MTYKKYNKSSALDNFFSTLGNGVWSGIVWIFKKIFGIKDKEFDKISNHKEWIRIKKLLDSKDEIHAQQAVIRADKFFDTQLMSISKEGSTFAERLRRLENRFSKKVYQDIWDAHKLRNEISHNVDCDCSYHECNMALEKFEDGLKNMGAL